MRKLIVLIIISSTVLVACAGKDKVPDGILPAPKMQEVLWDMVRVGEFLNSFVFFKDSTINKATESQKWYDKVYEVHQISKEEFDKSYIFYKDHPLLMKEILDSLSRKTIPSPPIDTSVNKTTVPDSLRNNLTTDSIFKLKEKMLKVDTLKKARMRNLMRPK
jgi:Domain of unknown function (DUF4296)